MSWLKLTSGHFYLMQGGSDQYIDRAKIDQRQTDTEKVTGMIEEFPYEWFVSELQRPKTIIVNLEDEQDGTSSLKPFTAITLLRRFEVPISFSFFEAAKATRTISELVEQFEKEIGTNFSDEFLNYEGLRVNSKIKFMENFELKNFPLNPIRPIDPDADEEEPSFMSVLLEVIWNSGFTIKPYLRNNPLANQDEDTIFVELSVERRQPTSTVSLQRPTSLTLEKAVVPKEFIREESNKTIREVVNQISEDRNIVINVSSDISSNTNAELNFKGKVTFADLMNTVALNTGTFWDWDGMDSAFLRKAPSV